MIDLNHSQTPPLRPRACRIRPLPVRSVSDLLIRHRHGFREWRLAIFCAGLVFLHGAATARATTVSTPFGTSYQVNVDASGQNIPGDAANEPSLCLDPNNPNRIAIGWRQFDTTNSDFRQAGFGYSPNGGVNSTFRGKP